MLNQSKMKGDRDALLIDDSQLSHMNAKAKYMTQKPSSFQWGFKLYKEMSKSEIDITSDENRS